MKLEPMDVAEELERITGTVQPYNHRDMERYRKPVVPCDQLDRINSVDVIDPFNYRNIIPKVLVKERKIKSYLDLVSHIKGNNNNPGGHKNWLKSLSTPSLVDFVNRKKIKVIVFDLLKVPVDDKFCNQLVYLNSVPRKRIHYATDNVYLVGISRYEKSRQQK